MKGTRNAPQDGATGQPCPDTPKTVFGKLRTASEHRRNRCDGGSNRLRHARLPSRQAPEPENKMVL
ncbi:MAG: hypothetical protein OXI83_14230, partial [Gemmatimonadota bacterium]|nr:hypothetical protein [Gemmatimonadota bacterium]